MNADNITDHDLVKFCEWFAGYHGASTIPSVFTTCMCGYFHTYPKVANKLYKRCLRLGLINVTADMVSLS